MDILSLMRGLSVENLAPVYLLHGEEPFLIERFVEALKAIAVSGPMGSFNYSRKKASEVTGAQVVAEVKSLPMMAARRLVIVDDVEKLRAADMEVLAAYLDGPVTEACLVLIGQKFDLRKGLFKKANGLKMVHRAEPLKDRESAAFVTRCAQQADISLGRGAAEAIADAVGTDCAALSDALERTGLFAGGDRVEPAHVEQVVTSVRRHSVFELVDALGQRQAPRAIRYLLELLANREEPIRINAMLARHIRQLLLVRIHRRAGMTDSDVAQSLGVSPFVANKLVSQSNGFSGPALETALQRLAQVDLQLKSCRRPGERVLEEALLDLCFPGQERAGITSMPSC